VPLAWPFGIEEDSCGHSKGKKELKIYIIIDHTKMVKDGSINFFVN